MTFAEVFEAWKEEHYKEITNAGRASYNRAFDVFAPLHKKKFRELRTADFQAVLEPYMKQSHSTISKHKQLITQMSTWAIREELITTNFAGFVKLPENIKKEKEIFSDADIEKLEADGSEAAKIVLMLIYTGMRIGELFALPLEDYHETYVVGGEKTAAGRNRIIPIRPEGRGYFQYFAKYADGPLLLSGYTGQRVPNNFRRRDYYPLLDRLGIDRKTPHATRHTYASRARRGGCRHCLRGRRLNGTVIDVTIGSEYGVAIVPQGLSVDIAVCPVRHDGQRPGKVRWDGLGLVKRGYGAKNHAGLFLPGRRLRRRCRRGLRDAAEPCAAAGRSRLGKRRAGVGVETVLFHVIRSFRFFAFRIPQSWIEKLSISCQKTITKLSRKRSRGLKPRLLRPIHFFIDAAKPSICRRDRYRHRRGDFNAGFSFHPQIKNRPFIVREVTAMTEVFALGLRERVQAHVRFRDLLV